MLEEWETVRDIWDILVRRKPTHIVEPLLLEGCHAGSSMASIEVILALCKEEAGGDVGFVTAWRQLYLLLVEKSPVVLTAVKDPLTLVNAESTLKMAEARRLALIVERVRDRER